MFVIHCCQMHNFELMHSQGFDHHRLKFNVWSMREDYYDPPDYCRTFEDTSNAIITMKFRAVEIFKLIDDYTYLCHDSFKREYIIKFYDLQFQQYIKVVSPWFIGINHVCSQV